MLYDPRTHDRLDKAVYAEKKKRAKSRECFYNHYSPVCTTFIFAQAQNQERSMSAPYGDGTQTQRVEKDSVIATRVCALARTHHEVGDAFTMEHIYRSIMLRFHGY